MSKNLNKVNFGEVVVEQRLGFKPNTDLYNGLCLANISKVEVEEVDIPSVKDDGTPSMWDMAGHKSYNFIIEFKQSGDKEARFITLRESIVGGNTKDGSPIEPKTWNNLVSEQFKRLQHIVNVLDKAGLGTKSKEVSETLYPDYADSVEARIAKAKKLFNHFADMINGKGEKPRYDGVTFWLKVIAKIPEQTYLIIPNYVGKGYLEVFYNNVAPVLEFSSNETTILKSKADAKGKDVKPDMNHTDVDAVSSAPATSANTPEDLLRKLGVNIPN